MTDKDELTEEKQQDDEVVREVLTRFDTKGVGWSGGEDDDLDVVDLDR